MNGFQPMNAVPAGLVEAYLVKSGIPQEIVRWKYFDGAYNRGRERGHVWLENGEVRGFLGLVPFGANSQSAWTCDWSVEPGAAGAAGIRLVQGAMKSYPWLFQLGGNERTKSILSRLSRETFTGAALEFKLTLRLGAQLARVRRKTGVSVPLAGRIPVRLPRRVRSIPVRAGVDRAIEQALDKYDYEYVQWQVGRCPLLASCTCVGPDGSVLLWSSNRFWRMAEFGQRLEDVLDAAVRHVYDQGGYQLSVLASRTDEGWHQVLRSRGFRASPDERNLNVLSAVRETRAPELGRLSFLDSDMGYRF
jgi:hypothetical protein